jgi:O-acetyl-ADP-ribose deacetylase (regulator of RNase III)
VTASFSIHNRTASRRITTVVFPSFDTGFGGVPPSEAARQRVVAWELFLEVPYPPNWERVVRREQLISGSRSLDPSLDPAED